jgi:hypothetical protein
VGSPAIRAERKAMAFDPYNLIRIMPAEGFGFAGHTLHGGGFFDG